MGYILGHLFGLLFIFAVLSFFCWGVVDLFRGVFKEDNRSNKKKR